MHLCTSGVKKLFMVAFKARFRRRFADDVDKAGRVKSSHRRESYVIAASWAPFVCMIAWIKSLDFLCSIYNMLNNVLEKKLIIIPLNTKFDMSVKIYSYIR